MVPSPLVDAQITAQERLRALATRGVELRWRGLVSYDEDDVEPFVAAVVPLVIAAQRQAIRLTDAYIARMLSRGPIGVDAASVIDELRGDTTPDQVYRRPFVTVWTALANGTLYDGAVAAGLARATATAAMDVQMAHRGALQAVQDADPRIRGFVRVADAGACELCASLDGAILESADAMGLHNGCGCGLEPVEDVSNVTPLPEGVDVAEHGEMGLVLTDPKHNFETL